MTLWRGVPIIKDPLSLTVNQQLLWELKPQTVIEFGAYKGGSALWRAEMLKMLGCRSHDIHRHRPCFAGPVGSRVPGCGVY